MSLDIKFQKLNIISAGAGSGKTYTVQTTLNRWLESNKIQADKILAVTFTKMAASEMQTRIKGALLSSGKLDDALKLEQATISTIHSFGQELTQSFVYEQGMSPRVRQLNDSEQEILLQLALSSQKQIASVIKNLEFLGYTAKYTGSDFITPIDMLQNKVMHLINSFRTIAVTSRDMKKLLLSLRKELTDIYGATEDESVLNSQLHRAVKSLLSSFPHSQKPQKSSVKKDEDFDKDFEQLQLALDIRNIETSSALWVRLQSLRIIKVDDNYKKLVTNIMEIANKLSSHPLPLRNAIEHIEMILELSLKTLELYNEKKRQNALIDFSDMLYQANAILENEEYIKEIAENFDCLVIDEFQDTNPIQFALLWKFQQYGVPTLIVGDLKQSIMGFQGADSSLFKSLIQNDEGKLHKLQQNYRTTPSLMQWINMMGEGLYKDDYTHLEPMSKYPSTINSMHIINFDDNNWSARGTKVKSNYGKLQYHAVTQEVKKLLESKQTIYDKDAGVSREIMPCDIAILAPSHSILASYASTLREYGVEVTIKENGFISSIIVQILYHALCYLSNEKDSYAGLYLTTTYMGDMELEDALKEYIENNKRIEHPLLERIDIIREEVKTFTISKKLLAIIDALSLWDFVLEHENSLQERANLLKFIQLCDEFESMQYESLHALGIYGKNLNTFLTWFTIVDEDAMPPAKSINTQAINLLTWHASKGLEWPVVVVVGLDKPKEARLPDISIGYTGVKSTNPIENTYVKFIPEFEDKTTNEKYLQTLESTANETINNLLYVSMTRAREQLILAWPSFYEDKVKEQSFMYRLNNICKMKIFADENKITMDDKELDEDFRCTIISASVDEELEISLEDDSINYGRVAIERLEETSQIASIISPSALEDKSITLDVNKLEQTEYATKLEIKSSNLEANVLGTLLHRCYEVLLEGEEFSARLYESIKEDIDEKIYSDLEQQVKLFKNYLIEEKEILTIRSEVPILYKDDNGSTISGSIDLLVESKDGYYIIDHKSDKLEDFTKQFKHHYTQLDAYAKSIQLDKPLLGVAINWIRYGAVSFYKERR